MRGSRPEPRPKPVPTPDIGRTSPSVVWTPEESKELAEAQARGDREGVVRLMVAKKAGP